MGQTQRAPTCPGWQTVSAPFALSPLATTFTPPTDPPEIEAMRGR